MRAGLDDLSGFRFLGARLAKWGAEAKCECGVIEVSFGPFVVDHAPSLKTRILGSARNVGDLYESVE